MQLCWGGGGHKVFLGLAQGPQQQQDLRTAVFHVVVGFWLGSVSKMFSFLCCSARPKAQINKGSATKLPMTRGSLCLGI